MATKNSTRKKRTKPVKGITSISIQGYKSLAEMPGAQGSHFLCDLAALREILIRHTLAPIGTLRNSMPGLARNYPMFIYWRVLEQADGTYFTYVRTDLEESGRWRLRVSRSA